MVTCCFICIQCWSKAILYSYADKKTSPILLVVRVLPYSTIDQSFNLADMSVFVILMKRTNWFDETVNVSKW